MRLQAYFAQALSPTDGDNQRFTQLPGISHDEIGTIAPKARNMPDFLRFLEENDDPRVNDVKKVMEKWGRVEIVDAAFKGLPNLRFILFPLADQHRFSYWRIHRYTIINRVFTC